MILRETREHMSYEEGKRKKMGKLNWEGNRKDNTEGEWRNKSRKEYLKSHRKHYFINVLKMHI